MTVDKRLPLICIPLTGENDVEIQTELKTVVSKQPDLIEWRLDFFKRIDDIEHVISVANQMKEAYKLPLLVTIRSVNEGGEEISLDEEEKLHLLRRMVAETQIDLIDYEVANDPIAIRELRRWTKEFDKQLILSCHNFLLTPSNQTMTEQMTLAESYGADIVKMAVMPETKDDVLRLLEWTRQMNEVLHIPIITMSMGSLGSLSRLMGWTYGSILTFAVGNKSSAPGQIPVDELREWLQLTKRLIGEWE